ncbi:Leucine Rich repeats (2 copies) [compost metagenome]
MELKKLKRLDIGDNEISNIPDDITVLEQLEHLNISSTHVATLPESMIGMKKLYVASDSKIQGKLPKSYNHLFDYKKTLPDY